MSAKNLHALLLENPLFTGNPMSEQDKTAFLAYGFQPRRYRAHTPIVQSSSHPQRMLIVESGWCRLEKYLEGGERQIVDFSLRGDMLGSAYEPFFWNMNVVSITDTIIFESSLSDSYDKLARTPGLLAVMLRTIARKQAIAGEHLANLGRRSALARTAHLLLELGVRVTYKRPDSIGRYACPLTQHDLADALGLTPIHLNRMLRELRELSMLSFRQGVVDFLDVERLVQLSGFDAAYLLQG